MAVRSSIRWRLTAFYGVLFTLCGIALLWLSYSFVSTGLQRDEGRSDQRVIEAYGFDRETVAFFYGIPTPASPTRPETQNVGDVIRGVQADIRTDVVHQLVLGSGIALAAMVCLSVVVGWLASGRALRPVGELTARAKRLSEDNLHERLDLGGPDDELKELADTLDGMIERLEAAFTSQRQFAANVSHELRTPLAVMRGEADITLALADATPRERHLAEAVRAAAIRSEALLESLLALSRSDSTMNDRSALDLADLTGDVVAAGVEAADRAGIDIDLDLATAPVEGDQWLLERLVVNLVDNAVKHNVPGGWLRVSVTTEAGNAVLRVANGGRVLDADDVARILEPFQQAERTGSGYGLGMTIVQSVVRAHGGSVVVEPRPEGGLDVTVRLPASATAPAEAHPLLAGTASA